MNIPQETWVQIIGSVCGLIGLFIAWSRSNLKKNIDANVANKAANGALEFAVNIVLDLVAAANQTSAEQLKKSLADGKITKEEYAEGLAAIKKAVMDKALALTVGRLIGSGVVSNVVEATGLLDGQVEAAIAGNKPVPLPVAPVVH